MKVTLTPNTITIRNGNDYDYDAHILSYTNANAYGQNLHTYYVVFHFNFVSISVVDIRDTKYGDPIDRHCYPLLGNSCIISFALDDPGITALNDVTIPSSNATIHRDRFKDLNETHILFRTMLDYLLICFFYLSIIFPLSEFIPSKLSNMNG